MRGLLRTARYNRACSRIAFSSIRRTKPALTGVIRLGLIVVMLVLCMRTVILLLSVTDDMYQLPGSRIRRNQQNHHGGLSLNRNQESLKVSSQQLQCTTNVSRPRADQIHTRNQHWQLHDTDTPRNELLIYSAFYDHREDVGPLPVIRILGVANKDHAPFYCQIWSDGVDKPYITQTEEVKNGRGDSFRSIFYGQYMYTCKLQSFSPVPTHVSMTTVRCDTPTTYLPVVRPGSSLWKEEFAICVPISFGSMDPLELVEWFELVQLLGVSGIHVYNATLSPDLHKLFNHYHKIGVLHVHNMPPPIDAFNKRAAKLASPASLNDCMLRNMFAYRYLIVVDFDEAIVPRINQNYTRMIDTIKARHKLRDDSMSYTFRNVYYFLDLAGDTRESKQHRMLRYRSRMVPSRYLYAAKSFIDPRRCLSVFNHYCYIRFPSAGPHWTVDVDTTIAMSHHYRNCNLGKEKCNVMYKSETTDDIMLRYRDKLHSLTAAVVNRIR